MANMQAWIVEAHGGPEALKRKELPTPDPGPDEARVKVLAVGLNHLDLWIRKGVEGHVFPLPLVPGCDVVGVVEALGARARRARGVPRLGTRVLINPTLSCGRCSQCRSHQEPLCREFGIVGETQNGGLADSVLVPARNLFRLPAKLSTIDAASLPIAYVTAWQMLVHKARVKKGDWVLIHGAGSGVSVAAIQIARLHGAQVIVTSRDPAKLERAKALGAHEVVDTTVEPFRNVVRSLAKAASRRGVDIVVDHVGVATFEDSIKCLDWGGRLVTCGATTGAEVGLNLKPLFFKNLSVMGTTMGSRKDFEAVVKLAADGKLKAVVDRILPMEQAPQAFSLIESGALFGKVVLTQ